MTENNFFIDDITWNDLDMEDVYKRIDHTSSSVGTEYLKHSLKNLLFEEEKLKSRRKKQIFFKEKPEALKKIRKHFKDLGRTKKISFLDYIFRLKEIPNQSNLIHFLLIILLVISIVLIFIKPAIGIVAFVVMIAVNIILYFKMKAGIEGYFLCLKYLVSMVLCTKKINSTKLLQDTVFKKESDVLIKSVKTFSRLCSGSWLITNSVSGSIIDVLMDYIRMIFHVDLIKFNSMKKTALENEDSIIELYNALGEIELAISVSEYVDELKNFCEPRLYKKDAGDQINNTLIAKEAYHPLLKEPVSNSISTERSVLLTGSNASGKSTFLKTLAICQILSQTIYICPAQSFMSTYYKVMTSMALSDDLAKGESYFVVEIKSLKRIFDNTGNTPVLCFIDEVLRGTNTIERIAASSKILSALSNSNALVFAATHDIELASLLKTDMDNYHFSENVISDSVEFDYKIRPGATNTSNAIKLLDVFGFDKDIVDGANKRAESFRSTGIWN